LLWEIYLEEEKRVSPELLRFKEENSYWLSDFALFKVLKAHHQGNPGMNGRIGIKTAIPLH